MDGSRPRTTPKGLYRFARERLAMDPAPYPRLHNWHSDRTLCDFARYLVEMDLTSSFAHVFPAETLARFRWMETRNAAAVLKASNPGEHDDVVAVLGEFSVYDKDILEAGGNRGLIAIRLDTAFAARSWDAVRVNTTSTLVGERKSQLTSRTYEERFLERTVSSKGFEVDNFKGRVALDVEWNAKDGNLDRDLSAYRALYDLGMIDVAVVLTRDHEGIRQLAGIDLGSQDAYRRLGTSTTTNMDKLESRLSRGDAGGCPVLAIGITRATWAGKDVAAPPLTGEALTLLEAYEDPPA